MLDVRKKNEYDCSRCSIAAQVWSPVSFVVVAALAAFVLIRVP